MDETRLRQLCVAVREARNSEAVERAAAELRQFLREQQQSTRTNLYPDIEKLFVAVQLDQDASN